MEIRLKLKGQEGLPRNKEFSFANTLFGCHPMWSCSFLLLISISFSEWVFFFFFFFFVICILIPFDFGITFFSSNVQCTLLFFYLTPGDKDGAPQNSIKGLFLPSFKFVFIHTKIVTCVLGYYLNIWKSVPFNVHINENKSMNAQWVLSPLSLSFSLTFSSPLSTAIAVLTLLQIPPFRHCNPSVQLIQLWVLYIYIYIFILFLVLYYVCLHDSFSIRPPYF